MLIRKILMFVIAMTIHMALVLATIAAFPRGLGDTGATLVCFAVVTYPLTAYWLLKKFCKGL